MKKLFEGMGEMLIYLIVFLCIIIMLGITYGKLTSY